MQLWKISAPLRCDALVTLIEIHGATAARHIHVGDGYDMLKFHENIHSLWRVDIRCGAVKEKAVLPRLRLLIRVTLLCQHLSSQSLALPACGTLHPTRCSAASKAHRCEVGARACTLLLCHDILVVPSAEATIPLSIQTNLRKPGSSKVASCGVQCLHKVTLAS